MGFTDKVKNEAEDLVGKGKELIGEGTNDPQLEGEGKADQTEASAKKVGEDVKDAAGNVKDTAKDALD